MEHGSKVFATRILLLHLLLLALVLGAVALAAQQIYNSARQTAIEQASVRQELLASQTSRGIESFYTTIASDLDLLGKADTSEEPAATEPSKPSTAPAQQSLLASTLSRDLNVLQESRGVVRTAPYFPFLWNQLNGRVSALFYYERTLQRAHVMEPVIADQVPAQKFAAQIRKTTLAVRDWIDHVERPDVSRLIPVPAGSSLGGEKSASGINLVCVPVVEGGRRVLVAVVPSPEVQTRFLPQGAQKLSTDATLTDANLDVIASTVPSLLGTNLGKTDDSSIAQIVSQYANQSGPLTLPFEQPGGKLLTIQPVNLPQSQWRLLLASPMSDVDAVVGQTFRTILWWAALVVLAITCILGSTALSMIRVRVRAEQQRHDLLKHELNQARRIQLNWLPATNADEHLDIAAVNHPASHISGDFYNWFNLPDGRQVVTIGDVTGHGMAAAFLMATTQLLVRTTMPRALDPGKCMEEVNRQLCTQVFHGQFVTMLILTLDLKKGILDLATAGHIPPLISENGGPFAKMAIEPQLVLAVDSKQPYPTQRYKLSAGSKIVLYTDGVLDAEAENGDDRFRFDRLQECVNESATTAQAVVDNIVAAVNNFRGKRELADDLTLVAIATK